MIIKKKKKTKSCPMQYLRHVFLLVCVPYMLKRELVPLVSVVAEGTGLSQEWRTF